MVQPEEAGHRGKDQQQISITTVRRMSQMGQIQKSECATGEGRFALRADIVSKVDHF
jgi:hypothetical protein